MQAINRLPAYTNYCVFYSYYLYSISHPSKLGVPLFDLSADETINIETSGLTYKQLAVERVIAKVFQNLHYLGKLYCYHGTTRPVIHLRCFHCQTHYLMAKL